jgi:hypothetical protein
MKSIGVLAGTASVTHFDSTLDEVEDECTGTGVFC